MQLKCETEELRQMALMMFGEKIDALEQRVAELLELCKAKDDRAAALEEALKGRDAIIADQQKQLLELTMNMSDTAMTTWALHQFLVLSMQKTTVYVRSSDNNVRTLLGQFMFQALPDNAPAMQLDYVRDVTKPAPPAPAEPPVTTNHYVMLTGNEATYNENPTDEK